MLFNSYEFILFFLPVVVLGFAFMHRWRIGVGWLVISSLVFYGWWNPKYALLLIGSVVANFLLGQGLVQTRSKVILIAGIAINLGVLGYFKYAAFFTEQLNAVLGAQYSVPRIVLPLAISFYTFQQITYLVECYRRTATPHTWLDYAMFVCFFPQLIAGPIVHESYIIPQIRKGLSLNAENLARGLSYFILGLFKKVVIADGAAPYANAAFLPAANYQALSAADAWLGTLAYTVQLYFDFSGYSDMAIGLGLLFGIRLPLNFDSPYKATSIIDFWRRWHMTLSEFLRNYVYIPLGGNRKGSARRYVNIVIVMTLGGFWHGAGWTFVLWGFLHGVLLLMNHAWRKLTHDADFRISRWWRCVSWVITFSCVMFAWVLFRAEDLGTAGHVLGAMGGMGTAAVSQFGLKQWLLICAALIIALTMPNTQEFMLSELSPLDAGIVKRRLVKFLSWQPSFGWASGIACIATYCVLKLGENSEFLYFNF